MTQVSYRHVRCFIEVARLSSVGLAAESLSISQPAVSKTLRELEVRVGVPLFDRVGRRLRLNAAGKLFQAHAGLSLVELDRGIRLLKHDDVEQPPLVIGVLPTVATEVMPRASISFLQAMPNVTLRVSTGPNWMLLSQLREARLDLVVGRLASFEQMTGLVFEQLYSETVIAVVRPDHPLTWSSSARLADFPLILPPPGAIIRPIVEQFFLSIGQEPPRPVVETVSLALGRGMVRKSDAIWFISRGVVAIELENGSLTSMEMDGLPTAGPVGITLRSGSQPSEALKALMYALRQSVG